MPSDPLASLVARALGVQVDAVEVERVATSPLVEVDRVRWRGPGGSGALWFQRMAQAASVEIGLLPLLARRAVAVPRVVASGIPPRHVREPRPWLLLEEPPSRTLCDAPDAATARAAGAALAQLQTATARDLTTLEALHVPALPPARVRDEALEAVGLLDEADAARLRRVAARLDVPALASLAQTLVHGALACRNVRVDDGRVVLVGWTRAHLGCELEDLARLCAELRECDRLLVDAAREGFGGATTGLRDAELLHWLSLIRWYAWELREGLGPRDEEVARIRRALAAAERT